MERLIYVIKCPICGWEAYRDTDQGFSSCSHCGHEGAPITTPKTLDFQPNPYIQNAVDCAKEFYEGLLDGVDIEDLIRLSGECKNLEVDMHMFSCLSGCICLRAGWPEDLQMKEGSY